MAWFARPKYTLLRGVEAKDRVPAGLCTKCRHCGIILLSRDYEENLMVCPKCGSHGRVPVVQRIQQIVDEGTFEETHGAMHSGDPLEFVDSKPYPERIQTYQERSGLTDAVVTGTGRVHGVEASLAFMAFEFIGGSMGSVVGEKVTRMMELALERRIPAVAFCTSGGARMQEGILSLMQMAKTSAAVARLRDAGVPYVAVLTDPTTAGVMASFASLGDLIIAEPGALIGFAGPRVIEQTIRQVLPKGFQRSEFVQEHGFIDVICERKKLKRTLARCLAMMTHADPIDDEDEESENGAAAS